MIRSTLSIHYKLINYCTSLSVAPSMNRERQALKSKFLKHGRSEFSRIIRRLYCRSLTYFLSSNMPLMRSVLKYPKKSESLPFMSSTYSWVSLKGAVSKLMLPGEHPNTKPKSMCMRRPELSINRFPLCLSLTFMK